MRQGDRVLLVAPVALACIAVAGALLLTGGTAWVIVAGAALLALVTGASGVHIRLQDRNAARSIALQLDAHERWLRSEGAEGTRFERRALDLTHFDLSGRDLSHADLEGTKLGSAVLRGTKFNYALLRHVDLESIDGAGASFRHVNLVNANLAYANLRSAHFDCGNLESATLVSANLQDSTFSGAMMRSARLSNADLTGAQFADVDLTDARLVACIVTNANLTNTRLVGADLREVDLTSVGRLSNDLDTALVDVDALELTRRGATALLPASTSPGAVSHKESDPPAVKLAIANTYAKSGRIHDALKLYEEIIGTDDDRVATRARIGLVEMYIQDKDLDRAASLLRQTEPGSQSSREPAFTLSDAVPTKDHVRKSIADGSVPATRLYSAVAGGQGWVRLCHDPHNVSYRNAISFWAGPRGGEIADLVSTYMSGERFDYVSLGCGDGRKDAEIVRRWLPIVDRVSYLPFDISYFLLSSAVKMVREVGDTVRRRLRINAHLNDFSDLAAVKAAGKEYERTVFSVLGSSLGSVDEAAFLRGMRQHMSNDDLLIVEVPVAFSRSGRNEVISSIEADFYSAPLRELGFEYDPTKLKLGIENNVSSIHNTITCTITYTDESAGLSGVRLAAFHYYSTPHMVDALAAAGYRVLEISEDVRRGLLACVVQPSA